MCLTTGKSGLTVKEPTEGVGYQNGVFVDIIVQQFDLVGTTTFVTNVSLDMHPPSYNFPDSLDKCSFIHPLAYAVQFAGWSNESYLVQNSLPWEVKIDAEFDAEISMLAFKDGDGTGRRERASLTMQHGEFLVSLTDYDMDAQPGFNKYKGFSDAFHESGVMERRIRGSALATA